MDTTKLHDELIEIVDQWQSGLIMDRELIEAAVKAGLEAGDPTPGEVDVATGLRYVETETKLTCHKCRHQQVRDHSTSAQVCEECGSNAVWM